MGAISIQGAGSDGSRDSKGEAKKADKENLCLLKEMKKIKAWESDISVECAKMAVKLAGCHERMHQRLAAIQLLRQGLEMDFPCSSASSVFHSKFSEQYRKRH